MKGSVSCGAQLWVCFCLFVTLFGVCLLEIRFLQSFLGESVWYVVHVGIWFGLWVENSSKLSVKNMSTKTVVHESTLSSFVVVATWLENALTSNKLRGACSEFCHQVEKSAFCYLSNTFCCQITKFVGGNKVGAYKASVLAKQFCVLTTTESWTKICR